MLENTEGAIKNR